MFHILWYLRLLIFYFSFLGQKSYVVWMSLYLVHVNHHLYFFISKVRPLLTSNEDNSFGFLPGPLLPRTFTGNLNRSFVNVHVFPTVPVRSFCFTIGGCGYQSLHDMTHPLHPRFFLHIFLLLFSFFRYLYPTQFHIFSKRLLWFSFSRISLFM